MVSNHAYQRYKVFHVEQDKGGELIVKGDLDKAKHLLSTTNKTCIQIATESGCIYQTVLNWSKKLRSSLPKSGEVKVTSMTDEDRAKYGMTNLSDIPQPSVPHIPEVVAESVVDDVPEYTLKLAFNASLVLSSNNISLSDFTVFFDAVTQLAKSTGNNLFNIELNIKNVEDGKDGKDS